MPVLFALQTAFSLWMLYDAIRRDAFYYWFVIILIPFGEWVYFFAVKLPELRSSGFVAAMLYRPPSVEQLRREYRHTPSTENRMKLAQRLLDKGETREAADLFSELLGSDPDDREALWGYARACAAENQPDLELRALERLHGLEPGYADYEPCYDLCTRYWDSDRRDEAIAILKAACKKTQRLGPRVSLAGSLMGQGRHPEALELLRDGLDIYRGSPRFVRHADRRLARKARELVRFCERQAR